MNRDVVLKVPYVEGLDGMSMEEIVDALDVRVAKHGINNVNWADRFPYNPITVFSIAHDRKFEGRQL